MPLERAWRAFSLVPGAEGVLCDCRCRPLLTHRWTHGRELARGDTDRIRTQTQKVVRVQKEEGRRR